MSYIYVAYFQYYFFCIDNCVTVTGVLERGECFEYKASDMKAISGSHTDGSTYDVVQWRGGAIFQTAVSVKIWTGYGCYNFGGNKGDWKSGDKFCVTGA